MEKDCLTAAEVQLLLFFNHNSLESIFAHFSLSQIFSQYSQQVTKALQGGVRRKKLRGSKRPLSLIISLQDSADLQSEAPCALPIVCLTLDLPLPSAILQWP